MRVAALAFVLACGGPAPSPGLSPPAGACATCYPTDSGVTVGSTVPDDCFEGDPGFCFADFFDPEGRQGIRLLEVVVLAGWDQASAAAADFITGTNATGQNPSLMSWSQELSPLGVRFLVVLDDGAKRGTGATLADLAAWRSVHGDGDVVGIDPGNRELGVFFDSDAVPLVMDVDARTMTLLAASVGPVDAGGDERIRAVLASLH